MPVFVVPAPQQLTVPFERSATLCCEPAAMRTTPDSDAGGVCETVELLPHATTSPSFLRASECFQPPAIAVTLARPAGTLHWLSTLRPQHATVPFCLSAMVWKCPAAIACASPSPVGTVAWPSATLPQHTTVPSLRSATEWKLPPAIACTDPSPAGTLHCASTFRPHAVTPLLCAMAAPPTIAAASDVTGSARPTPLGRALDHSLDRVEGCFISRLLSTGRAESHPAVRSIASLAQGTRTSAHVRTHTRGARGVWVNLFFSPLEP